MTTSIRISLALALALGTTMAHAELRAERENELARITFAFRSKQVTEAELESTVEKIVARDPVLLGRVLSDLEELLLTLESHKRAPTPERIAHMSAVAERVVAATKLSAADRDLWRRAIAARVTTASYVATPHVPTLAKTVTLFDRSCVEEPCTETTVKRVGEETSVWAGVVQSQPQACSQGCCTFVDCAADEKVRWNIRRICWNAQGEIDRLERVEAPSPAVESEMNEAEERYRKQELTLEQLETILVSTMVRRSTLIDKALRVEERVLAEKVPVAERGPRLLALVDRALAGSWIGKAERATWRLGVMFVQTLDHNRSGVTQTVKVADPVVFIDDVFECRTDACLPTTNKRRLGARHTLYTEQSETAESSATQSFPAQCDKSCCTFGSRAHGDSTTWLLDKICWNAKGEVTHVYRGSNL